jgi:hypothetical protein
MAPLSDETSIDPLGRVTASNQQTAGELYGFTYYYNLAGARSAGCVAGIGAGQWTGGGAV